MSDVKVANPVVLGLLGFGMTAVLLSLALVGVYPVDGVVFAMVVFFGGVALTMVSVMLFRLGDTFGMTAFGGYSFLWLSFGFLNIGAVIGWWTVTNAGVGWYLIIWAVFSLGLVVASMVAPRVLTIILVGAMIFLASLGLGATTGTDWLNTFGGYEGIVTGALAVYLAFAFLINEMYGKTVLPIGAPFRK